MTQPPAWTPAWLAAALLASACQAPPPPLQRMIAQPPAADYGERVRRAQREAAAAGGGVRLRWEFAETGSEKDWTVLTDVEGLRRENGRLRGTVKGVDPAMAVVARLPAAGTDGLWLEVASERGGNLQVFWATAEDPVMTERKSLTVPVPESGVPAELVLPVGAHPDWTGQLINLRIDPPPSSGAFAIDFVRIVGLPPLSPSAVEEIRRRPGTAIIDGESRVAQFSRPPDRIVWDVDAGPGSVLRFAYGLLPESWTSAASSVRFSVTAARRSGGGERTVFSRDLHPHTLQADRSWHWAEVPVGELGARALRLTFSTEGLPPANDPGAPAGAAAYAVWGQPEVVTPSPGPVSPPNLVLVALDAARADRMGVYGYGRDTTPAIDAFAARATVFEHARSQASWSLPSYASLFTSLYPSMIGVTGTSQVVPADAPTLAALLRGAGYTTAAFTGGGFAGRGWGLGRGFDLFWEGADPRAQLEHLERWLGRRPPRPFFLYLHTYEAHDYVFQRPHLVEEAVHFAGRPLRLPADVHRSIVTEAGAGLGAEPLAEIGLLYDGALRVADRQIGRWLNVLHDAGALDNAVVVLFSDHGEAFGEHAVVHHRYGLFEELVRVPLVVRRYPAPEAPGGPRRVGEPAQLLDLLPTLLELAGVPVPGHVQGRSLAGLLAGRAPPSTPAGSGGDQFSEGAPAFFAHVVGGTKYVYTDVPWARRAETDGREPFLRPPAGHSPLYGEQLFDVEEDPGETVDLALSRPGRLSRARELMVVAYVRNTPGLKLLVRGGTAPVSLAVRLRGADGVAAPRLLFPEPADLPEPMRLRVDAGDLDLVSWDAFPGEALSGSALELEPDGGAPLELRLGPGCEARPRDRTVVGGPEILAAPAAPEALPSASAGPVACVVFTPRRTAPPGEWRPSAEALERLRSLGYVR